MEFCILLYLIVNCFQVNTNVSCRKNGLDIDSSTFHQIFKHEIKFHLYKMHLRHELFPP